MSSRGRRPWLRMQSKELEANSKQLTILCHSNIRLQAYLTPQKAPSPTIILLPGLFGHERSTYVISAAMHLWQAGFSIVRLVLRDHGNTAHLNPGLFNCGELQEVIEAVTYIDSLSSSPTGLLGFSMGGNYVLRLQSQTGFPTLAVCPTLNPAKSAKRVDLHWLYRSFFVNKWHRFIRQKVSAYPQESSLLQALSMLRLNQLTEFLVHQYSQFPNVESYYASHTLNRSNLQSCNATILYATEDPVIPATEYAGLPKHLQVIGVPFAGHCAFLENPFIAGWSDQFAEIFFKNNLPKDE